VLGYSRRHLVVLFAIVAVAAGGLGVDRWRRANPDTVAYLETLDRAPAPPPVSARAPQTPRVADASLTSAAAPRARIAGDAPRTRRPRRDDATPLDVNLASAAEFERLPGVGPALAARIVDLRQREGPFASVDDLRRVRGVGHATLERLRPRLAINTP
jgi:competence ComEA-like helix-hairpin-helix protein